jgi:hypothetical protein
MKMKTKKFISNIIMYPGALATTAIIAVACLLNSSAQAQILLDPTIPSTDSFSSFFGDRAPWHLIDNSGLTAGPSGIVGASDSTASDAEGTFWYSNPFTTPADDTPWVIFNLGGVYTLQSILIWQYNQAAPFNVYGASEIQLFSSTDDTNFTPVYTPSPTSPQGEVYPIEAIGTNGEPCQVFPIEATNVQYIMLQIWNTFGGPNASGLSKVRFVVDQNSAPPLIAAQPQPQTQPSGGTATFMVAATSPTQGKLSYQWMKNGTNLTDVGNISGALKSTLTVTNIGTNDQGEYAVAVSDTNGPTLSTAVHLLLGGQLITPAVTSFSSQLNTVAQAASNTVSGAGLSGAGMFSDTMSNYDNGEMWLTYGNTEQPQDLNPFITYDLGGYYNLLITRIWNFNDPNNVYLGVSNVEVSVSTDGANYTPIATNEVLEARGYANEPAQDFATPASTVRYVRLTIFTDYNLDDFLDATFAASQQDERRLTGLSKVRFEGNSSSAQLPIIKQQPQNLTNIVGQTAVFTVSATDYAGSTTDLAYQWKDNGTNLTNGVNISGATTSTLTLSNVATKQAGSYTVVVRDMNNNLTTLSQPASLQVVGFPTLSIGTATNILIDPSIAAYSSYFGPRNPTNLVDGADLTVGPSGILGAPDSTAGNNSDNMWYTNPFIPDLNPSVTFNLGAVFDLQTTIIWQYNQPSGFAVYGAKDINMLISDEDTNFTLLTTISPTEAGGTNGEPSQVFDTVATNVQYVTFNILDTFGGSVSSGTGLSAVQFTASNTGVALTLGGSLGLHYQVQYRNSLNPSDPWQVLQDIPALGSTSVSVTDSVPIQERTQRFYRAVLVL